MRLTESRGWYFNLQTPLRGSTVRFDVFDYFLDVVVLPDRTAFWTDEHEFAASGWPRVARSCGLRGHPSAR
jgi:predicted RNA-binding protein associated with RNAse of E/G family